VTSMAGMSSQSRSRSCRISLVRLSRGDFLMTEQRPRMRTRAMVLPLEKGDAAAFAVNSRPMRGMCRDYPVKLNHGVSKLYTGKRHTIGVILHDAV